MKKSNFCIALFFMLTFSYPAISDDNFFFSLGGIYSIEDFDREAINDVEMNLNYDFDNAMGLNAKVGYVYNDNFTFGLDLDILRGYEWDMTEGIPVALGADTGIEDILAGLVSARAEMDFFTGMAFARVSTPWNIFKPYLSIGAGMIWQDADVEYSVSLQDTSIDTSTLSDIDYDSYSDICAKAGIGIEMRPLDKYSFWFEASYTAGFNEMEDIKYSNFTAGASIFF